MIHSPVQDILKKSISIGAFLTIFYASTVSSLYAANVQDDMDVMHDKIESAVDEYVETIHKEVESAIKDAEKNKGNSSNSVIILDSNGNTVSIGSVENHGGEQKDVYRVNELNDVTVIINKK